MQHEQDLQVLRSAASPSKKPDRTALFECLVRTEKSNLAISRSDLSETAASRLKKSLTGSWQLVYTTGTVDTQDVTGKKGNYFPIKAVQSFDCEAGVIKNGIYIGAFCVLQFGGDFDIVDARKGAACRVVFDFDRLLLLSLFDISIGGERKEDKDRPFFSWILCDDKIATARGKGGGLALWKRI
ncbi:hypothetical protein TrRE_jg10609 [Triparma retinervis]|uniref:Plastid lipid-associated protein/fibrillin conserved domain-containing protein n=1 Tax=Triparma retinervis TaxID=2557542 RepID=A0A9W7KV98_9STRA|nr:hypothetical protein TrRE_jg10609 [Triparma retinervis]